MHGGKNDRRPTTNEAILEFSDVTIGRRFSGEAFLLRRKFYCHFHPVRDSFFLETFVWNKLDDVVQQAQRVIPHPEYARHGWTRLPIATKNDVAAGLRLVKVRYRILKTTRTVAICNEKFSQRLLESARNKLKQLDFNVREADKTFQVMIQALAVADYELAGVLLDKVVKILRE